MTGTLIVADDLPGRDDERAAGGDVVAPGGRGAVGGGVIDAHLLIERAGEGEGEHGASDSGVPLDDHGVADRQVVVVEDRSLLRASRQRGRGRVAEQEQQRLVGFGRRVASQGDADRLRVRRPGT